MNSIARSGASSKPLFLELFEHVAGFFGELFWVDDVAEDDETIVAGRSGDASSLEDDVGSLFAHLRYGYCDGVAADILYLFGGAEDCFAGGECERVDDVAALPLKLRVLLYLYAYE